jgi:hypothetical protein
MSIYYIVGECPLIQFQRYSTSFFDESTIPKVGIHKINIVGLVTGKIETVS